MYPREELRALAAAKAARRQLIVGRRVQCAAAADVAARPLRWIDTALDFWRRVAPVVREVAIPLGREAARAGGAHGSRVWSLLQWAPVVIRGCKFFLGRRHSR